MRKISTNLQTYTLGYKSAPRNSDTGPGGPFGRAAQVLLTMELLSLPLPWLVLKSWEPPAPWSEQGAEHKVGNLSLSMLASHNNFSTSCSQAVHPNLALGLYGRVSHSRCNPVGAPLPPRVRKRIGEVLLEGWRAYFNGAQNPGNMTTQQVLNHETLPIAKLTPAPYYMAPEAR